MSKTITRDKTNSEIAKLQEEVAILRSELSTIKTAFETLKNNLTYYFSGGKEGCL